MKKECPICGGELVQGKVRVAIAGSPIGSYDGYMCNSCGEEFLREGSLNSAHEEIVRAGLFGIAKEPQTQTPKVQLPFVTVNVSGTSDAMQGIWAELKFSSTAASRREVDTLHFAKNETA